MPCRCELLDFFTEFTNGLVGGEMPSVPSGVILWGTAHHDDKPLGVKIAKVFNENIEAIGAKLVVRNHFHEQSSITKSIGFAILILPSV